jgi:hypothetical protein
MQQMNFYCRSYCLLNMFRGTIMPIIRSSRVLYKWLLHVVFCAWFSSFRYGVELRVVCPSPQTGHTNCRVSNYKCLRPHLLLRVNIKQVRRYAFRVFMVVFMKDK